MIHYNIIIFILIIFWNTDYIWHETVNSWFTMISLIHNRYSMKCAVVSDFIRVTTFVENIKNVEFGSTR